MALIALERGLRAVAWVGIPSEGVEPRREEAAATPARKVVSRALPGERDSDGGTAVTTPPETAATPKPKKSNDCKHGVPDGESGNCRLCLRGGRL